MATVLEAGACETDISALASCCAVCFPFEYCKGSSANLAFFSVVLLDHLDVWVLREAILADRGEVRGFPTRAVEILLDLRRHLGPLKAILWIVGIDFAMRVVYSIKDGEGGALGLFGKAEGRTKFKIIEALRLPCT